MLFIADNEQERVFIEDHPQPSICFPFDSPPLIKATGNGNLGRSYISNLLSELEKQLGLTFNFQNVTFENYLTKMTNDECQAFIMAEGFAQQLGLEYTASSLLNTEIVLVSNLRDVYFTRPELIQDLKVGSVARLPIDAFNIPPANSIVAPYPELLKQLEKRELDALAMIREQAGYMMTTHPERDLSVIANAGQDYRFIFAGHPRNATFFKILERGLKKISSGFINQEYRQAMSLVPTKETNKIPIIAMGAVLLLVTLVAAVLVSLSRRKAAKNALIAQMQNDFLSNMSHELRTPLNGVFGIFQLLELEDLSPKCQQMVEVGLNSTRTLSFLINDILDYDKLHQDKVAQLPKPTHVIQQIQGIINLHITQAKEKSLFIHLEVNDDVPEWVAIDPVRLEQLCNNIIGNAVKFTETGGLTISVKYQEEILTLVFNDTGIGMSKELQHILFERFTQGYDNKTQAFRGTGLGMAICKELVALMGGSISVQSTKGVGSIFTVTLPAKETPPVEKSTPQLGSLSGLRVLCADDDNSIQKVMSGMLTKLGAQCVMVNNGVEAMSAARKSEFDLILMDINMPIMGGIEFLADYRRTGGTLPVVAFTSNAMLEDVQHYESLGFSTVLTKPVALEHLYQTLKSFI
jgi:signal transduction histidine kinase